MKTLALIGAVLLALSYVALAAPVPDTGLSKCYDNHQEIPCPNPGEPFYGQDAQYPCNPQSYSKLDASGNTLPDDAPWPWAMVRDNVTGLIWEMKTDDGSIHDMERIYGWYSAKIFFITILNLRKFGGFSDWRLPTVKELSSIVYHVTDYLVPAINTDYFFNTQYTYWSSNTLIGYPLYAWYVGFFDGSVFRDDKSSHFYVRGVRAGQCGSFDNFVDNGDETVTDTNTGLMWQKDTAPSLYSWQQALSYCENLTLSGYSDWRLPNKNELQSIIDYNRHNPSIDPTFSNTVSFLYWSSTTYARYPSYAWYFSYYYGYVVNGSKLTRGYVRAVRGGQCGGI